MSQDRGDVPSDGERLTDRGTPPEDNQGRNTKPSQIAGSYDLFGNPLMPAAADSNRVPGGDRGHLDVGDCGNLHFTDNSGANDASQPVPVVYTEKKPISNNIKIAALVGSIFAVGGLVFVLMANPFKGGNSSTIGDSAGGFHLPSFPKATLSPHDIFKTCGPSIVTLQIETIAYQVSPPKFALVQYDDPEKGVMVSRDDDEKLHLWLNGKQVPEVHSIWVTPKGKIEARVRIVDNVPAIYLIAERGKTVRLPASLDKYCALSTGSGFFVRPDVVVTNYHVVSNEDLGVAGYQGGTAQITDNPAKYQFTRKPIAFDPEHDLALVYVPGTNAKTLPMKTDVSQLTVGEPVYALGSPKGVAGSLSEGLISSDKLRGKDPRNPDLPKLYLQHSAKIDHGNSGGPLVNDKGEVVGVNTAGVGNGTVNLAVVSKFIDELVKRPDVQAKIDELGKANQTDLKGGSN